jgi:DNA-binding NarL/FixJ family response regulator
MSRAAPASPIRVILADDHSLVRAGIRQILEHAGDIQVVAEADNGEDAQALARQFLPDVIVLDIQMPRLSGIDAARWIRANTSGVGVLILTAYDDPPYVMAVLQAGANGYVLKTASPDELIQSVRDVSEGKAVFNADLIQNLNGRQPTGLKGGVVEALTERELEVLTLAARGYTNKAIAVQLSISDRTVQGHLAHIFDKLQASSRTEAVMRAIAMGWIAHDLGAIADE